MALFPANLSVSLRWCIAGNRTDGRARTADRRDFCSRPVAVRRQNPTARRDACRFRRAVCVSEGVTNLSRDELQYLVVVAHRAGRMAFVDGNAVAVVTPIHRPTEEGVEYACIRIDHVDSMPALQVLLVTRFDTAEGSAAEPETARTIQFGVG